MKANYCKVAGTKNSPTLQVSTYQMAILLLFNDSDTVPYDEISEATSLNKETLDPSLGVLVKAKILLPQPESAKPESGTTYKLNTGFKSKKMKINLNITIKSDQKQEVEDTHKTIEEDRKMLMQVRIWRILVSVLWDANVDTVCHCAYYEVEKEDEASAASLGNHPADPQPLHTESARDQEVHRHPVGEGVPGAP
jgi:hypothetical protein